MVASVLLTNGSAARSKRLRNIVIGANPAAPLFVLGEDGTAKGMGVEVLNEAARRAGYTVSWRIMAGEPENFLYSGSVDVWPTLSMTPERRKRLHLTEPWLHNRYCLISTVDHPAQEPRDLIGQRVAYWGNTAVSRELAHRLLSKSILVPVETRAKAVEAVCTGLAVAGITPDRTLEPLVLKRPRGCEATDFVVRRIDGADSPLSIGARRENADVADSLLEGIEEMAEDGTLANIGGRWSLFGANETKSLLALRQSQRWNGVIGSGLAILTIAALTLLWQLWRGKKTEAALQSEMLNRQKAQEDAFEAFAHMEHQAYHDSLTGLPNRRQFDQAIGEALAIAEYRGHRVALFCVDLDRFKQINDSLGHSAGDALLRQTAERLKCAAPPDSFLARLGGDEFAIILSVDQKATAIEAGDKFKKVLAEPFLIDGAAWHCPGSIGLSHYPDDAQNAVALLKNADTAMYRAKKNAPGQLVTFASYMGEQQDRSARIEQAIWRALQNNGFSIHYQAQFDGAGRLSGFEALLRLNDDLLGPVPPSELIPVAENTGSIVQIGEWILRAACRQAVVWAQQGLPQVTMAVNVSPLQLAQENFSQVVEAALADSGMPPRYLELEITETAIMEESPESLLALKRKGVRIAVDDFGTGYSSLGSLHRLSVHCVKIDRSFVSGIDNPADTLPFIRAIVALARSLDMEVLAEGVETEEQFGALRKAGCDRFQGYLLARPQPEREAVRHLVGSQPALEQIELLSA